VRRVGGGLQSRWATVGGLRIHARAGGLDRPGLPVLLVPGIGVSSRYFVPLARRLLRRMPTLAIDLPGAGRSRRPPHALSISELADALAAWLDAVGIDRAACVGNSMGCQVLLDLASRAPERVDRLVLVSPTIDAERRSGPEQLACLLRDVPHEPLSLLPIVAFDYLTFGPIRFVETGRFALADRPEDKLPLVEAPTLVVRGDEDPLVPQRWAEQVAGLLPNGRLVVLRDEPHACHYSAADRVARLVLDFLEEGQERSGDLRRRVEHRHVARAGDDEGSAGS
jgi:2-hydroxy-6-oxonona-2,4-dienedioate hydrolase